MKRQELIPLDQIQDYPSNHVNWQVDLPPYAPTDQIGVDIARFDRMARIGGFNRLNVVDYAGETTEYIPEVNGVTGLGEATAAARGTLRQADLYKADMQTTGRSRDTDYDHADATISLNIAEVTDRLGHKTSGGALRSPQAWAGALNAAATGGIRSATRDNLFTHAPVGERLMLPFYLGGAGLVETIGDDPSPEAIVVTAGAFLVIGQVGLKPWLDKFERVDRSDRRISIVQGIHADRILAVEALSRTRRLIKPIDPAE